MLWDSSEQQMGILPFFGFPISKNFIFFWIFHSHLFVLISSTFQHFMDQNHPTTVGRLLVASPPSRVIAPTRVGGHLRLLLLLHLHLLHAPTLKILINVFNKDASWRWVCSLLAELSLVNQMTLIHTYRLRE